MVQSLQLQSQQSRGGFPSLCPLERHPVNSAFSSVFLTPSPNLKVGKEYIIQLQISIIQGVMQLK